MEEEKALHSTDREKENIIEAVLFTFGKAVDIELLCVATECEKEEVKKLLESLIYRYEQEDRAMQIIELEGSYQMCTKKKYYDALIRVTKTPKKQVMTDALLETLSIIAYKQPITKAEIEHIRGVSSEYSVNKLIEYGLVYETGRLEAPGKPALFGTTEEFLRRFGISSKQNLPDITPLQEAEIELEIEEELKYKFGFEESDYDKDEE